jgi:hypothetical protein
MRRIALQAHAWWQRALLAPGRSARDPRVDVARGAALLMIFVDHMPGNPPSHYTLHNFGFADAAEVFVLLAGVSSMMAYGRVFARDGAVAGLKRVGVRCLRIYACQVLLLLATLALVRVWTQSFGLKPTSIAPLLDAGAWGLVHGLLLHALPDYLDILPLYVVLLALFPLVFYLMRWGFWWAIAASVLVWGAANLDRDLNLPNWLNVNGWYFNPFTWQLLFVIGAALAVGLRGNGGSLPRRHWLVALSAAYLTFACLESAPWHDWGLPSLRLFPMAAPDKSSLAPLRILDIGALFYLVFSSERLRRLAMNPWARAVEACGKHSLEIFGLGCLLALVGRLVYRTWGRGWPVLTAVNVIGLFTMCAVALWMEHARRRPTPVSTTLATAE